MPVLVFSRIALKRWQLQNLGQGPAMSVIVGDKDKEGKWTYKVAFYPLAAGAVIELPWSNVGSELAASYTDIHGKEFSTLCNMSGNQFYEENKYPDLKPIGDEVSLRAMIEEYRRTF